MKKKTINRMSVYELYNNETLSSVFAEYVTVFTVL